MPEYENRYGAGRTSEPTGRQWTAAGHPRAGRATQFMPFSALTGYHELARQQERNDEERHDMTEEEALALSGSVSRLRRGEMVRATYYQGHRYQTVIGPVTRIELDLHRLRIGTEDIGFQDLWQLERLPT